MLTKYNYIYMYIANELVKPKSIENVKKIAAKNKIT